MGSANHHCDQTPSVSDIPLTGVMAPIIWRSLRLSCRPKNSAHRSREQVRRDWIRAGVLVTVLLLVWAMIHLTGTIADLDTETTFNLCLLAGLTINLFSGCLIFAEKHLLSSSFRSMDPLAYFNLFITGFKSACLVSEAPPPRTSLLV